VDGAAKAVKLTAKNCKVCEKRINRALFECVADTSAAVATDGAAVVFFCGVTIFWNANGFVLLERVVAVWMW
jgi:hypothetical protein